MTDLRLALAILAGMCVTLAALAAGGAPSRLPAPRRLRRLVAGEMALAAAAAPGADWRLLAGVGVGVGVVAAGAAWVVTALPVLAAAAGAGGVAAVRVALVLRAGTRARQRQDEVVESVRMLRGLLEAGGVGVQQALAVMAERGPAGLRAEFATIVAAGAAGRQVEEWGRARARVADPLFDMLCAAVLVQRPAGGALAPLFAHLEESVSAIHEVTREAQALQVQARSAAGLIVLMPPAFLVVLSALRSPYLEPYRSLTGEAFLAAMLAVIGLSYAWILRSLRLPGEPRLEVTDA